MIRIRLLSCSCVLLVFLLVFSFPAALLAQEAVSAAPTGHEILKKSDDRLIPEQCTYALLMETIKSKGKSKVNAFMGYKKGSNRNVLIVKKPKRVAGSVHLKKDDVIWSYYTTNHRLTKVAYQAVFMGTLLNYGDILATELSTDYNVVGVEDTGGKYTLTLTPKKEKGGYGKITLIVDKKTFLPEKRSYYAVSGVLMKECVFTSIKYKKGKLVFMEMDFLEPMKKRKTTVRFTNIKIKKDIPEKYYNENFIKFLGGE